MAARVHLNTEHLVISKAGYDAGSPSLPDSQKVFDSEWGFYANLLFEGFLPMPGDFWSWSAMLNRTYTINFPETLNYVPAALIYITRHGGGNTSKSPMALPFTGTRSTPNGSRFCQPKVYNDRIEIPGPSIENSWGQWFLVENQAGVGVRWFVFGL